MKIENVKARTESLQAFFDRWTSIVQRYEDLKHDQTLTELGKADKRQRLDQTLAELLADVQPGFTKEYDRQEAALIAARKAISQAEDNALAPLTTDAMRGITAQRAEDVTAMLRKNRGAQALRMEFAEVRYSGASVIGWRRALRDFNINSNDLRELQQEVEAEYTALLDTADVRKAKAREVELQSKADGLQADTFKYGGLIARSPNGAFELSGAGRVLSNLSQRIQRTSLGGGMFRIDFVRTPDEVMQASAQPETFTISGS